MYTKSVTIYYMSQVYIFRMLLNVIFLSLIFFLLLLTVYKA